MENQSGGEAVDIIETTIGDLVALITEIALENGNSEEEGYQLASITLERILRLQRKGIEVIN